MTMLECLIEVYNILGGKAYYKDVYEKYAELFKVDMTDSYKAAIRKTVEDYSLDSENFKGKDIFYAPNGKGKGYWGLRDKYIVKTCPICGNNLTNAQYLVMNNILYKSCPRCSQDEGMHVHYFCPEGFGVTEKRSSKSSPIGIQSLCIKCRGSKKGPHEGYIDCKFASENNGYIISEIRFLPMSNKVFTTLEQVKDFIINIMPNRDGKYYYKSSKMIVEKNSFVLFQYEGKLVGYGIALENVDLKKTYIDESGEEYNGYYRFAENSLVYLEDAITADEFKTFDVDFTTFNQSHQKKVVGMLPSIFEVLKNKGNIKVEKPEFVISEEIDETNYETLKEGTKKQITVNAYERNNKARLACLRHYKKINSDVIKCEICGFNFSEKYGEQFADKIHVHHVVEIATIGDEYVVDPVNDLIPICPNCHMVIHSKKPAYTPEEIKNMIKGTK